MVTTKQRKIIGIAREALKFALSVCKSSHPKEFAGMLYADGGVITRVDIPITQSSNVSAVMNLFMLPVNPHLVGSVHSHPSGDISPSATDIKMFMQNGDYHIIIGYPYDMKSWRCYNRVGNERHLDVVDVDLDHKDQVLEDIMETFGKEDD
jgi:proteasome lid subunit RPN8/RPN11